MWKHRSEHPFFSPGTTCMMSEDDNSIKAMVVAVVVEVVVVVVVEVVVAVAVVVPIANGQRINSNVAHSPCGAACAPTSLTPCHTLCASTRTHVVSLTPMGRFRTRLPPVAGGWDELAPGKGKPPMAGN